MQPSQRTRRVADPRGTTQWLQAPLCRVDILGQGIIPRLAHQGEASLAAANRNVCVSGRGCRVIHVPNRSEDGVSLLFPQRFLLTLNLLAGRWGDPPWAWGKQSGCPTFGPLGTGTGFCYNKSCFRNSLLALVLVCTFKPLERGAQVVINPPPAPTMSVCGQGGTASPEWDMDNTRVLQCPGAPCLPTGTGWDGMERDGATLGTLGHAQHQDGPTAGTAQFCPP